MVFRQKCTAQSRYDFMRCIAAAAVCRLFFCDDMVPVLVYTVGWNDPAHTGSRIYVRAAAHDGARIEHAVAADLYVVSEHCAELLASGLDGSSGDLYGNEGLVTLYVAGYRAGTHVGLKSEHGVAHIVIMRGLDIIKEYNVFEFNAVADNGVPAYDCAAANESAVADLGAVVDYAGRAQICGREYLSVLCYPYALAWVVVFIGAERGAELEDKILYAVEDLPWVCLAVEQLLRNRFVQIKKFTDFYHDPALTLPLSACLPRPWL